MHRVALRCPDVRWEKLTANIWTVGPYRAATVTDRRGPRRTSCEHRERGLRDRGRRDRGPAGTPLRAACPV
ncbi:hypothetical protein CLM82_13800, partial [Streptomyces albidoflavus]